MTNLEQEEIAQKLEALRDIKGFDNKKVKLWELTDEEIRKHEPPDTKRRTESWKGAW